MSTNQYQNHDVYMRRMIGGLSLAAVGGILISWAVLVQDNGPEPYEDRDLPSIEQIDFAAERLDVEYDSPASADLDDAIRWMELNREGICVALDETGSGRQVLRALVDVGRIEAPTEIAYAQGLLRGCEAGQS